MPVKLYICLKQIYMFMSKPFALSSKVMQVNILGFQIGHLFGPSKNLNMVTLVLESFRHEGVYELVGSLVDPLCLQEADCTTQASDLIT